MFVTRRALGSVIRCSAAGVHLPWLDVSKETDLRSTIPQSTRAVSPLCNIAHSPTAIMPRPHIDYFTEIGPARGHEIVNRKRLEADVDPEINCWSFAGSANTDGYGLALAFPESMEYKQISDRPKFLP